MKPGTSLIVLVVLAAATITSAAAQTATPLPSAPPSATYQFTPPAGWNAVDHRVGSGTVQILGAWRSPNSRTSGENLNLASQHFTAPMTADAFATAARSIASKIYGESNIITFEKIKVCHGTQDAFYEEIRFPLGAQTFRTEQVATLSAADAYILTYSRFDGTPEDPQARASIDSLCVPPTRATAS